MFDEIKNQEACTSGKVAAIEVINLFREYNNNFNKLNTIQARINSVTLTIEKAKHDQEQLPIPEKVEKKKLDELDSLSFELLQLGEWLTVQSEMLHSETPADCIRCGLKLSSKNEITKEDIKKL